jgi:hypothetical protein
MHPFVFSPHHTQATILRDVAWRTWFLDEDVEFETDRKNCIAGFDCSDLGLETCEASEVNTAKDAAVLVAHKDRIMCFGHNMCTPPQLDDGRKGEYSTPCTTK